MVWFKCLQIRGWVPGALRLAEAPDDVLRRRSPA